MLLARARSIPLLALVVLESKGVLEMGILVVDHLVEYSGVQQSVFLLVSLPQSFVLAFFEVEELALHVDSLIVLDDNDLVVRVVSFVLEPAEFLHINFLIAAILVVDLHAMDFEFFCIFEGDKLLGETVLVVANIVGYLVVGFHRVVVFVVAVFLLFAAHVAQEMLEVDVHPELVLVEEMPGTEFAVGVHEGDVSELVDVPLLQMLA